MSVGNIDNLYGVPFEEIDSLLAGGDWFFPPFGWDGEHATVTASSMNKPVVIPIGKVSAIRQRP
jgi:hypothetical protein